MVVDYRAYRTASFDRAFIRPRLSKLFDAPWSALRYFPITPDDDGSVSSSMVNVMLLAEAISWLDLGLRIDHFATEVVDLTPLEQFPIIWTFVNDVCAFMSTPVVGQMDAYQATSDRFPRLLDENFTGITTDNEEFLRLFLFASAADWDNHVDAVKRMLSSDLNLESRTPNAVDEIMWFVRGSGITTQPTGTFSDWRSTDILVRPSRPDRAHDLRELQTISRSVQSGYSSETTTWASDDVL